MEKTALVTGGAGGIGTGIVRALSADGWRVYVHYHTSGEAARRLAAETGGLAIEADVTDLRQVTALFEKTGEVALLVNNAGVSDYGLFTELAPERWRHVFSVNVDGVFHCTRCALPAMLRQKRGCILNISSIWGIAGAALEAAYAASKAAVIGLTKSLAKELGPSGIRVNCVAPGVIDTEMNRSLGRETLEALRLETPLMTLGTSGDIGGVVAFLASEQARFITGQVISPNGGFVI